MVDSISFFVEDGEILKTYFGGFSCLFKEIVHHNCIRSIPETILDISFFKLSTSIQLLV